MSGPGPAARYQELWLALMEMAHQAGKDVDDQRIRDQCHTIAGEALARETQQWIAAHGKEPQS